MIETTYQLKRYPPPWFMGPRSNNPPATPSEYFSHRYPVETERWGCPFLELVVKDLDSGRQLLRPIALNDNFFAAILSDQCLGHSVVYFVPEQQWYFLDPRDHCYHPTTEEKLMTLLSALLLRCGEAMPRPVDRETLFIELRGEDSLKAVLKKARSILAADHTFFSADSPQRRVEGVENHSRMAVRFVREAVKKEEGRMLPIGECYVGFSEYCRNNNVEPVARNRFKQLIIEVMREEFGLSLRGDLKNAAGQYVRGWKGLTAESVQRN